MDIQLKVKMPFYHYDYFTSNAAYHVHSQEEWANQTSTGDRTETFLHFPFLLLLNYFTLLEIYLHKPLKSLSQHNTFSSTERSAELFIGTAVYALRNFASHPWFFFRSHGPDPLVYRPSNDISLCLYKYFLRMKNRKCQSLTLGRRLRLWRS